MNAKNQTNQTKEPDHVHTTDWATCPVTPEEREVIRMRRERAHVGSLCNLACLLGAPVYARAKDIVNTATV